jgi:hypothetical protein
MFRKRTIDRTSGSDSFTSGAASAKRETAEDAEGSQDAQLGLKPMGFNGDWKDRDPSPSSGVFAFGYDTFGGSG